MAEQDEHMSDAWFLDDGQLQCRPVNADIMLRTLDVEAAKVGASRAVGLEAKSVARLVGSPSAIAACPEAWMTDYIRSSCTSEPSRQQHVLGVDFGAEFSPDRQFQQAIRSVADLHDALSQVEDTACELILLRKCADVCKIVHLLRAAGPRIQRSSLDHYDAMLERSLLRCLGGGLDELSLE